VNTFSSLKKGFEEYFHVFFFSFEPPHISNRRASSLTCATAHDVGGLSAHNSTALSINFPLFIPDYTVKASSDVMYLVIKRTTYLRALKATSMSKKPSPSDIEFDKYLERVNEDDNILMSTPKLSPEKPGILLDRSGRATPTLPAKPGLDQHHRYGALNNSFHTFSLEKNRGEDRTVEEEDENQGEDEGEFWSDDHLSNDDKSPKIGRTIHVSKDKSGLREKSASSDVTSIVSAGALIVTVQSQASGDSNQTISPTGSISLQP